MNDPREFRVPAPVLAEIRFGLGRLPEGSRKRVLLERQLESLLTAVTVEPWTAEAAEAFARLKLEAARKGSEEDGTSSAEARPTDAELAIAAAAIAAEAVLLTRGRPALVGLAGLEVMDWGRS